MQFNIWQAVQVKTEAHPRHLQAGTVQALDPQNPTEVGVKFDTDGVTEVVKVDDLKSLT
jgi:uncharacterized protein YneR